MLNSRSSFHRFALAALLAIGATFQMLPALAQPAGDTMIFPQLHPHDFANPVQPGHSVGVDGNGGYLLPANAAADLSERSFLLYFNDVTAGDLICADDFCSGSLIVPEGTETGTHVISTDGGSNILVPVGRGDEPAPPTEPIPGPQPTEPLLSIPGSPPPAGPPITSVPATVRETAVIKLTGDSDTVATYVTAAGTGASYRLTRWRPGQPDQAPVDSAAMPGYDVQLLLANVPGPIVISAARRDDGQLWLSSWKVEASGSFTHLDTRAAVVPLNPVRRFGLAGRFINGQYAEILTPVVVNQSHVRMLTWRVNADGLLSSQQLSLPSTEVVKAGAPIQLVHQTGNEYALNYRNTQNDIVWEYWSVGNDGQPQRLLQTARHHRIDAGGSPLRAKSDLGFAALPLTASGQVLVDYRPSPRGRNVQVSTFEHRRTNTPLMIATNSDDRLPHVPGVLITPPEFVGGKDAQKNLMVTDGLFEDVHGSGAGTLFSSAAFAEPRPATGFGSIAKAMTMHMAVQAAKAGWLGPDGLDTCVTLGGGLADNEFGGNTAVGYSSSTGRRQKWVAGEQGGVPVLQRVPLAVGDQLSLRTLMHLSMMISDGLGVKATARFVAQRMVEENFAPNDPNRPQTFAELVGTSNSQGYFVHEMQKRAESLGMTDTRYCDPVGRCGSTPQDQISFWMAASQDPDFVAITSKTSWGDADQAAELARCGTRLEIFSKGTNSATLYPGFSGSKDGVIGSNLGVNYQPFTSNLVCNQANTSVRACESCLAGVAMRLDRPLFFAESRDTSTGNSRRNAFAMLNYGFQQVFTPDYLASASTQGRPGGDAELASLGPALAVSSSVRSNGQLEVCLWNSHNDSVAMATCQTRSYFGMPNGSAKHAHRPVVMANVTGIEADGDFLTAHRTASGELSLDLWRIGRLPQ